MPKLWDKGFEINADIERYTVGHDRELDLYLAQDDVLGSMAHVTMLASIGLIGKDELPTLLTELKDIYHQALKGDFVIEEGIEDVHSQVELAVVPYGVAFDVGIYFKSFIPKFWHLIF